jgi:hypothetical protein
MGDKNIKECPSKALGKASFKQIDRANIRGCGEYV